MTAKQAQQRGLQIDEDRAWQEKFWTVQRVAWVLMALFIVAVIAGLTGNGGPFASASARTSAGTVEYPRVTRWLADEQVTLRLAPSTEGEVEVLLPREFGTLFTISSIVPEPSKSEATAAGDRLTFDIGPGGGEKTVVLNVTTAKPVLVQPLDVKVADAPPARLTVTILP